MRLREFFQPHFLCLNPCKKNAKWQCVSNAVSPCPTGTLPRSPQLRVARLAHKKMRSAAARLCFAVPSGHTPLLASTSLCSFGSQKNAKCSRKAVLRYKSLWKRGAGKEPFFRKGFPRLTSYAKLKISSRAASNSSLNCSAFAVERLSSPMTVKSILSS